MSHQHRYETQTKSQLTSRYSVSRPTFNKWLNKIPGLEFTKEKRVFTPREVEKIYTHLGEPPD